MTTIAQSLNLPAQIQQNGIGFSLMPKTQLSTVNNARQDIQLNDISSDFADSAIDLHYLYLHQ